MGVPHSSQIVAQARHLLVDKKMRYHHVATTLGVSVSFLVQCRRRFGWATHHRTGPRGGPGSVQPPPGLRRRGRYWKRYQPSHPFATTSGYVAEHRLVYEAKIGRILLPHEVVHHLDGDPHNNDPSNLQHVQTNADHLRHERTGQRPNWTPEGLARRRPGVLTSAAIHRRSKTDAAPNTRPSNRPTS